jgi:phosphinothricin acetyltransferase
MNIKFEEMTQDYGKDVIDIFNYYAENSFAAYPDSQMPYEFYGKILEMTKNYPAYVIRDVESNKVSGFCFLRAYNPFPVFRETAEISYFIDKDYVGQGIGKKALGILEEDAKKLGVKTILASITSLNTSSIKFHQKNGFKECGRLLQVGRKFGKYFDILWMQKDI